MRVTDSLCLLWGSDKNQCFQLCSTCTREWKRHRKHPLCFAAAPPTGLSGDWAGFVQLLDWTHWITVVISDLHVHFEHNWWLKMLHEMFGMEENRKKVSISYHLFQEPRFSHLQRKKNHIYKDENRHVGTPQCSQNPLLSATGSPLGFAPCPKAPW